MARVGTVFFGKIPWSTSPRIFYLWSVTQGFHTTIAKGFLGWPDSKERCVHCNYRGPSRRLAPVRKCSPFLSFFQRYIVGDISLARDIAGSLLLGVLAGSLKFYPPL